MQLSYCVAPRLLCVHLPDEEQIAKRQYGDRENGDTEQ
jgi:hypothetical protein